VALKGKRDEPAKGIKDFRDDPVGRVRVFLGNVMAYVVEVGGGFQVKRLAATHARGCAMLRFGLSGGQRPPRHR
jgi:hypothetical protein